MAKRTIKTDRQARQDVMNVIISTGVASVITGDIRPDATRRLDSKKEDIVLNTLLWDADQLQGGIININIFVPNLSGQTGENPTAVDRTQPNAERMIEIANIIVPALDDYHGFDFSLRLRNPGTLESYGTEHLYNIQVEYLHVRTDILN